MCRVAVCLAAGLLLLGIPRAYPQEVRASITGLVTDPSGAAVANATVTVTNIDRNIAISAQSNSAGNYVTPFLAPDATG